jgi:DNA-binding LacI/PurR family transcriptional regulator
MTSASPDSITSVSRLASPKLTTVNSRVHIGRASVDLLLTSAPGGWADVQPVREMPTELVMRESSGVAAIERAPAGIAVPVGGALFDL